MSRNRPHAASAADAPAVSIAGVANALLVTGAESGGQYALAEMFVPPDAGPPPHTHTREDEVFYVVDGEVAFNVAGVDQIAPAGTVVNAPRDVEHAFRNTTDRPARVLVWIQPAGLEQYFLEVGMPMERATDTPPEVTQEHIERLLSVGPQYGLSFRPPA